MTEMTHAPESGAAMPAGLAAILAEPGWRSNNWIWYFDVDQSLDGNPGIYVSVDRHVPFTCSLTIDDVFGPVALRADQVAHVLALMRRIEAALDADRAGAEGER